MYARLIKLCEAQTKVFFKIMQISLGNLVCDWGYKMGCIQNKTFPQVK